MKTNKFILGLSLSLIISATSFAQRSQTEEIKVWGNCGMCEATIEKAAKSAGATEADWNSETKVLKVSYRTNKTSADKIQQAIAATGYDTRDVKGSDEAYANLHGCCKYDRAGAAASEHMDCCGKDGKCSKSGHAGKDCCKKDGDAKKDCCTKDGKCSKEGHSGKDCCKKSRK